jgi:hypothetical protein
VSSAEFENEAFLSGMGEGPKKNRKTIALAKAEF